MVVAQHIEIDNLKLLVLKLQRMQFGRKSEKLDRQIEQLELRLEDLEAAPHSPPSAAAAPAAEPTPIKPARRPLPESLPRVTKTHPPKHQVCPDCGGNLRPLGEDVSEMLEYVPAHFEVIRVVRPKLSCSGCEHIVQAPAPSRPIDRGLPGPGLLAHVLVAKYADHLPLYRQSEIYEHEGIELDRSTLAGWVGGASGALAPLVEQLKRYVMSTGKLHGDDTPVPVLAPGNGKTKTGRLWTYVRDDRPAGDDAAPAVWFAYSPNRKGEHPERHLNGFRGTLQADGYAGFNRVYEKGGVQEAACWAQVLRSASGARLAAGRRGDGADRATLRDRDRDPGQISRRAARRSANPRAAAAGVTARVASRQPGQVIGEVGDLLGGPLRAGAAGCPDALLRRRAPGDRQQRGRARVARRRAGTEELPVRRERRGRRRRTA